MQFNKKLSDIGYNVNEEAKDFPNNPEMSAMISDLIHNGRKNKTHYIPYFVRWIREYPNFPSLRNHLYTLYFESGFKKQALDLIEETVLLHPNYIFGKANKLQILLGNEALDEPQAKDLMGWPPDLRANFPKESYHVTEFKSYYFVSGKLAIRLKEFDIAKDCLRMLILLDEKLPEAKELANQIAIERMSNNPIFNNKGFNQMVDSFSTYEVEQTSDLPFFEHTEISALYEYSLDGLPDSVFEQLMALPRASLVADLEKVLYDAMQRYEHFCADDFEDTTNSFPVHALYVLVYIKAEEALPTVLNLLRQGEEVMEYWFSEDCVSYLSYPLFVLGQHKPDLLKGFMFERHIYGPAKCIVVEVMSQVAIHTPERRPEVIEWFREVWNYFFDNEEDTDLIDSHVLDMMASYIMDFKGYELLPEIERGFSKNWISEMMMGDLETIKADIVKPIDMYDKMPIPLTWQELYNDEHIKRHSASHSPALTEDENDIDSPIDEADVFITKQMLDVLSKSYRFGDEDEEEDDDDKGYFLPPVRSQEPIKYVLPKAGRNDPCPCGSGKKYKKCCG